MRLGKGNMKKIIVKEIEDTNKGGNQKAVNRERQTIMGQKEIGQK